MRTAPAHEFDVAVVGQTFCDLVFEGAPLTFAPGTESYASNLVLSAGGAATRAVAAARLGAHTALVSELGSDEFGGIVRSRLQREEHLSLDWVEEAPSTPVTVALTSAEDRAFLTWDAGRTSPAFDAPRMPGARYVHVGMAEGIPAAALELRASGTRVVGGVGWDESGEWSEAHLDALSDVDVFCPNADEAMAYARASTLLEAIELLAERVPTLIVTDGPRGAWIVSPEHRTPRHVPGFSATAVDPTGAGDVFVAAVMVELANGSSLEDAVRFANAAASLAVAAHGGAEAAPHRSSVLAVLSGTGSIENGAPVVDAGTYGTGGE